MLIIVLPTASLLSLFEEHSMQVKESVLCVISEMDL